MAESTGAAGTQAAARAAMPTGWRVPLAVRLAELEERVDHLPTASALDASLARVYLREARAGLQQPRNLLVMWRGSDIEYAWQNAHAAEVQLIRAATPADAAAELPGVLEYCRTVLGKDTRLATLATVEKTVTVATAPALTFAQQTVLADTLQSAYAVSDAQHVRARGFRNILLACTAALFAVAITLMIVGFAAPRGIATCTVGTSANSAATCPAGGSHPTGPDVLVVMLLGFVGAALSGAAAVRKLSGTATPYAVALASLALKLPAGALTALVGILLIRAGFASTVSADTQATVVGWAVVFGAAQHVFLHFVDKQSQAVLGAIPTGAATAPAAGKSG